MKLIFTFKKSIVSLETMAKKEWSLVVLPLFIAIFIDQITKDWALTLTDLVDFGFVKFALHFNHGAMLGLFSNLPAVLRIVSLSTFGIFLLCFFALIQYLLPIQSLKLRAGMSILIGGIMGNVLDRILFGYVVDFIIFNIGDTYSPAFNLADAIQWIGYFLIVYSIIKEGDLLWPEKNSRKQYWVNMRFQLKYCLFLSATGAGLTLIAMVFSYTFLRVTILDLTAQNQFIADKFLIPFVITFSIIGLVFCAILFAVGRLISHRIAGPLYAFERFLDEALDGKNLTVHNQALKLRAGDEFRHLEDLAEQVRLKLVEIHKKRIIEVIEYNDKEK